MENKSDAGWGMQEENEDTHSSQIDQYRGRHGKYIDDVQGQRNNYWQMINSLLIWFIVSADGLHFPLV